LITMLFVPTLYAVFHRKEGRRQIAEKSGFCN